MTDSQLPFFSIIIPTYERGGIVGDCLLSLTRLHYPRDRFEVILVDDGSRTPPSRIVAEFQERLDVTLVTQEHAGQSAARNNAARRARGDFLAFTDDDCWPARDWLATLAARFVTDGEQAIGGRTMNPVPENPYSSASQAVLDFVYRYYNEEGEARFFASNNFAVPAAAFRELGGFNELFSTSEDREFCERWRMTERRLTYAPEAVVFHAPALTFRKFMRMYFNYGRGAYRFHRWCVRRGRGTLPHALSFYRRLLNVRRCSLWTPDRHGWRRPGLVAAWQAVNAAGYVWEMARTWKNGGVEEEPVRLTPLEGGAVPEESVPGHSSGD